MLYFGGSNGIIKLNPFQIDEKFKLPKIVFTQLIVNNKVIEAGEVLNGNEILHQSIPYTNEIALSYDQNHLSLSFVADDFLGPDNITYSYQLVGLNNEWVNLGNRHQISFTELGWGDYELLIKASRNNQQWSELKRLKIHIATPPWLTWYAYLFYACLFLAILLLVRHISHKQASLRAEIRIIQIEKEKEHELNEAKITFFTNISHEFRTPLTLILSPITELLTNKQIVGAVKETLVLVESNAKKMLGLVNELLDFKKAEQGLLTLNRTRTDIVGFTKAIYLNFKEMALSRKINYFFETNVEEYAIDFDKNQLEIVLNNLLSNAFKFTKNKGTIRVSISTSEDSVAITIADNGMGIAEENKEKIFNRFFQIKNTKTAHLVGSGIGLSFSKNIIDLHGGTITVESELNKGATFRIELPVLEPVETINYSEKPIVSAVITEKKAQLEKTAKTSKPLVLIADDSDDIRKYLKSLLEKDYDILEVTDGLEALSIVNKRLPDLVVSDVMMPNMDGIQLCEEIKNQINTSHIPIILLTARTSLSYEISGLQKGADDYITKPFNPSIVQTKIANLLNNRKKLREYFLNKVRFEPHAIDVSEPNLDNLFIDKAMKIVHDNLQHEDFGVEEMADKLFMSQSTLLRKIKALTGLSVNGFIRSVKLKNAAQLILETDLKMSAIAYEVGFSDYKYFTKAFQSQFGCLPSEYKAISSQQVN
jgi:signal transduction histidine kinase/DNA-binding response OmpR family regulator